MQPRHLGILILTVAALTALCGCARPYHDYPCGCAAYDYLPRPPLPYTTYCGCPTPIAAKYWLSHPTEKPIPSQADQEQAPLPSYRP